MQNCSDLTSYICSRDCAAPICQYSVHSSLSPSISQAACKTRTSVIYDGSICNPCFDRFTQGLYFHMIRSSNLNNYTTNKTREVVYFLKMFWRLQTARTSRLRNNHLYLKALIVNALPNVYIRSQNISESSNTCFRNSSYISFQQAGVVRPLRAR